MGPAHYRYDEWGLPTATVTTGAGAITPALAAEIANRQVLRYAGCCYDQHSGMYYLSARTYDPTTRQFLTKDPAKADGEESAYQYCGGDPVGRVDPSGLHASYIPRSWPVSYASGPWTVSGWHGADKWVCTITAVMTYEKDGCSCHTTYGVILKCKVTVVVRVTNSASSGFYVKLAKSTVKYDSSSGGAWSTWMSERWRSTANADSYSYTASYRGSATWVAVAEVRVRKKGSNNYSAYRFGHPSWR